MYIYKDYTMRLAQSADAEQYYEFNFNPLNKEVAYYTGSPTVFDKDVIMRHYLKCCEDNERYDFMIFNSENKIIGECIINEIDNNVQSAHFRIALFQAEHFNQGIGSWATTTACQFVFEELGLNRLALEVFSFNPRAIHTYEKLGFVKEGVLRQAVLDGDQRADIIIMSLLADEWYLANKIKG